MNAKPTVLFLFFFLLTFSACKQRTDVEARHYDIRGKVISVDKAQSEVTLAHEEIPGFMGAMTMSFKIKDRWALDVMKPGDQVNATLTVAEDTYLEAISVTQSTGEQPVSGNAAEPVIGAEVPNFRFANQEGRSVSLKQFHGRPVLLTFIYSRCPLPDYCIRMSSNFAEVARQLQSAGIYSRVELLSITIDPKYDKPAVLKRYAKTYVGDLDPNFSNWQFLSADPGSTRKTAQWFGLTYLEENGQIVHSLRTAVIDPEGKLAVLYRGNEWRPADAAEKLKQLIGSSGRAKASHQPKSSN